MQKIKQLKSLKEAATKKEYKQKKQDLWWLLGLVFGFIAASFISFFF